MGKITFFAALTVLLFPFAACTGGKNEANAVSGATVRKGPPARVLLQRIMPGAAADGVVKIAVVVNLKTGDQSQQFIEGCVGEGRAMGFTVDSFITGGDEERCGELLNRIVQADYDGLVFSTGSLSSKGDEVSFNNILKPAAGKGLRIVTYEALPPGEGGLASGLTVTYPDPASAAVDPKLAGTVDMRLLAAKLAGESPPDTFGFPPGPGTDDLNRDVNMSDISVMVSGRGEGSGLFDDYPWMEELKAAGRKYLRISPAPEE